MSQMTVLKSSKCAAWYSTFHHWKACHFQRTSKKYDILIILNRVNRSHHQSNDSRYWIAASWTKTTPSQVGFPLCSVVSHTLRANQIPRSRTIKFRLIKLYHPTTTSAGWTERNGTTSCERNHFTTVLQSECNCGGHWLDLKCFVQLLRCWCWSSFQKVTCSWLD